MALKIDESDSSQSQREDLSESKKLEEVRAYERLLQKAEGEVRHHISVEQQMKLCLDSFQGKIEALETEARITTERHLQEIKTLQQEISLKEENLQKLSNEIKAIQQENRDLNTKLNQKGKSPQFAARNRTLFHPKGAISLSKSIENCSIQHK